MLAGWGYASLVTGILPGMYDEDGSLELETSGYSPVFLCTRDDVADLGVAEGTILDDITTHSGRVLGAHVVRVVQRQDDGEFIVLRLELS